MKASDSQDTVSLKELRERFPKYIEAVARGRSFTVLERSKPVFQIGPVSDDGRRQTIADFTAVAEHGVAAADLSVALD